ncbi:MAG: aminotransferase class III-fold pyridoxal phosphate-dependent enzyme, partial [Desulfobacterales bacterium]|nr:aminotransferase class III-fold pyridoxal phosphate-dependent enzyme [Desulfobacterales bacterium]
YAPEVYRAPFGDIDAFKEFFLTGIDPESVAAVIAEPIQGEGGFIAPPKDFFKQVKAVCEEHGILFVADEIQSGMGRTGKMFAIEHFGVEPDLMTVAKSLGAGMPLSAVVGKAEIMDSVHAGGLGGTYGANPLACAAALAVFKIFEEEDLLAQSVKLGETLQERFGQWVAKYEFVGETRGLGAMAGFTIVDAEGNPDADRAKKLAGYCAENGLILLVCGIHGNVVRVLMPLTIEDEVLEKGLSIIQAGLDAG